MVFKLNAPAYSTEIQRKEGETILYINYLGASSVPSIADSAETMARAVDALTDNPEVSRIVFVQQRNYNYPFEQVSILLEISQLYTFLLKQERILAPDKLNLFINLEFAPRELSYLLSLLRQDPVACYLEVIKRIGVYNRNLKDSRHFDAYLGVLDRFRELLLKTRLISSLIDVVDTYAIGDRKVYYSIFRPDILPNFTLTRLVAQMPQDAEIMDQYELKSGFESVSVMILKVQGDAKYLYHIMPPEYALSEEHHLLLNLGKGVLLEYQPKSEEFVDSEKVRSLFFNVARDLLSELSVNKNIPLNYRELNSLARILVRQTIGFGLVEVLLFDDKLQDIFLNSPIGQNYVFVRHAKYGDCVTNILPSYEDADSWASKLRLQSGRPLDEANPILDTDIFFGNIRARVAAIQRPLSPTGIAYALRRHREEPWTLPLFIENKMINSFTAGLMSFIVDGNRTMLIAGTRSSGKTSLLGSVMLEVIPSVRMLVVEDTLELSVDSLRKLGYNIQRMKVRSALLEATTEVEASEGIRASLRLGDSALIVGEVRSSEAKALYEAMRVGALANLVAGTIHGASPYGVFDRVVNDLGVPVTSFKATDIVVVANPIRTPDGMHYKKRVTQLTEVRKHWLKDPEEEKGFVDLIKYNVEKDELEPTEDLMNGDSEIVKAIAGSVKGWAGNWDAVWDNILLRAKIKQEIVDVARKLQMPSLMEAKFNALSNDMFHRISEKITHEIGLPVSDRVFPEWRSWLMNNVRKI
ncbi:type II/IV secretion system ATPase subunit [Candidatus Pacearchaeota archaeon]|nr:type II/IV secretion system ATPase subunit [Candidatus Pacearchaeota archaeon]